MVPCNTQCHPPYFCDSSLCTGQCRDQPLKQMLRCQNKQLIRLHTPQEIQDLQSVAVPEHIGSNRTAQAAKAARYPVTLSTYSFQLLMAFLQGSKLWLLLGIVNEHIKVQVLLIVGLKATKCTVSEQVQYVYHNILHQVMQRKLHVMMVCVLTHIQSCNPHPASCQFVSIVSSAFCLKHRILKYHGSHSLLSVSYVWSALLTSAEESEPACLFWQEVAAPVEDGVAEETTLLTGPIQGDVVTINQKPMDLMLLQVSCHIDPTPASQTHVPFLVCKRCCRCGWLNPANMHVCNNHNEANCTNKMQKYQQNVNGTFSYTLSLPMQSSDHLYKPATKHCTCTVSMLQGAVICFMTWQQAVMRNHAPCSCLERLGSHVCQDNVEDKWREQKAADEEGGEAETDEQGKPLTKKQRQQLKRAADKERAKQRQATEDRMESQVVCSRCLPALPACQSIYVHIHIHIYIHIYLCNVCVCACMYVCMYVCICICSKLYNTYALSVLGTKLADRQVLAPCDGM